MARESKDGLIGSFVSNSTFFLSGLYLFATAVGLIYSWVLYGRFGINIFDYSEVGDFLLAAFKNPLAFLPAGLLTAMALGLFAYWAIRVSSIRREYYLETGTEASQNLEEQLSSSRATVTTIAIIMVVVGVLPSLILPFFFARSAASSIKNGETAEVEIQYRSFKGSAGQVTVPDLQLIGATQKASFFYDPDDQRTLVIPQAQLVSVEVPE